MEYNRYTTSISAAYETFSASLAATYLRMKLDGASRISNAPILKMQVEAHQLMNTYLARAETLTNDYMGAGSAGAPKDASRISRTTLLMQSLRVIAYNNAVSLVQKSRTDIGSMLTTQGGAMGELQRKAANTVELTSRDAAGRTWRSEVLVKTLARDFAYQTFIDGQVKALREQGATAAQVTYLDPTHENHNLIVAITGPGTPGVPNLAAVRDTIFHVNSNASLSHVHP